MTNQNKFSMILALSMAAAQPAVAQNEAIRGLNAVTEAEQTAEAPPRMPEEVRQKIDTVVVIATRAPADDAVGGTYDKDTPGLLGGIEKGGRIGTVNKQIGPVPVRFGIPIIRWPAMIIGGVAGVTQKEIQEFRDAMTEQLADADNSPLTDDGLALDVFWGIRRLPTLDSRILAPTVEIPAETDAVLFVNFNDVAIDVQGKDAIITTSAEATLRSIDTGKELYAKTISYQDRDALKNWIANENVLWRTYANYARFYLGRAVSAAVFDEVAAAHTLLPQPVEGQRRHRKNQRLWRTRSSTPTLAWSLSPGDAADSDPWLDDADLADVVYDVEIFDSTRLVYAEEQLSATTYTLAMELPCNTYWWSVRPVYRKGHAVRFGEWLRLEPPADDRRKRKQKGRDEEPVLPPGSGIFGRQASLAPAYVQDFPMLEVQCGR